jgi:hypothetical protein
MAENSTHVGNEIFTQNKPMNNHLKISSLFVGESPQTAKLNQCCYVTKDLMSTIKHCADTSRTSRARAYFDILVQTAKKETSNILTQKRVSWIKFGKWWCICCVIRTKLCDQNTQILPTTKSNAEAPGKKALEFFSHGSSGSYHMALVPTDGPSN